MQVSYHSRSNNGFTIVEVIVAITVMTVLSGLLFKPLSDLLTSNIVSSTQVTQDSDTRSSLRQIAGDLTYSTGFVDSIATPPTPTGPDNGTANWTYAAPTSNSTNNVDANTQILMARLYATDQASDSESRMPVGAAGYCDLTQQVFVQNTYIYFVKSGTLYRRTMTNNPNSGTPCSSMAQKQSCNNLSNPVCESSDAVLLKNVTSFLVEYRNGTATAASASVATSAKITVRTAPPSTTSPVSPTQADITISLVQQTM